jgi:hypothetical protein
VTSRQRRSAWLGLNSSGIGYPEIVTDPNYLSAGRDDLQAAKRSSNRE